MKWGSFTPQDYDINKLDRKEAEAYGEMQRLAQMQRKRPLLLRLAAALMAKVVRRTEVLEQAPQAGPTLTGNPLEG
jgi:hypothetical protein